MGFLIYLSGCGQITPSGGGEKPPNLSPGDSDLSDSAKSKGPTPDKTPNRIIIAKLLTTPEKITFKDVKVTVFNEHCMDCHNSEDKQQAEVALNTHGSLMGQGPSTKKIITPYNPEASVLYETLILPSGPRRMPPKNHPPLSENQKKLIFQWILNGAKEKLQDVVKRPQSLLESLTPFFNNPERIDHSTVEKFVFNTGCLDCHSTNGSKADFDGAIRYGQDMTDYAALFTNHGIVPEQLTDYVIRENGKLKKKKGSRIYKSIAIHQTMPRPLDGYPPLSSLRTKLLRLWIENCAIKDYGSIQQDHMLEENDPKRVNGKIRDCSSDGRPMLSSPH